MSQHEYPVLILGESGTGKELVARSMHFSGPRKDRPFAPVDCSSLVPTLIESELFGYVKGRIGDGKLPRGGQQRPETIARVRMRETVQRLSEEWEAQRPANTGP